MKQLRPFRARAARLWRALWPVLVVVAGAVTCDAPTSLGHRVSLAIAPVFGKLSLRGFSGMTVDAVRLTVIRPPSTILAADTLAFSPDSSQISAQFSVQLASSHEQLIVLLEFLSGSQLLFTGVDTVDVTAGGSTTPATIPIAYVGPGNSITSIHITPRDSGAPFGSTVPFVVTATDASNANVPLFYISWSTSRAGDTINAAGMFRAGATRGLAWVRAHTPSGIWDSARVLISPAPSLIQKVAGDGQSAALSTALSQPLVVIVLASDNLPVVGALVQFAASGGGQVTPASAVTDTLGQASTTATLGSATGAQTFTASVAGVQAVSFSATATAVAGTIQVNVTGLTGSPANGGSAVAQRTDAAGSPITINISAAGSGNSASVPAGTYTITYTPPAGFVLAGATINPQTAIVVGVGATATVAFGVQAAPTTGPIQVTVTGLTGSPANGGSAVAQRTDAAGSPITINISAAGSGSNASAPAGTYTVTYTPPSGFSVSGSSQVTGLVVAAGATATATFTVVASASQVATTVVTPHLDTLTSVGDTVSIFAQAKNATGGNVTGTFTFVSRFPSIASVTSTNAVGHVTAVANGSTYVVATEAGLTKDSALIVVQQRIATINVTPATRNIYLSRTFTFSAAAVDGRGNAMPGVTTFTWSSTAPAVASVDTAHTPSNLVTALGLGTAQIRATSGAIIGVSNVSVLTPITRIAVVVDTVGAFKTDTFSLASLGLTRRYRAIAHDTLDAVMAGITFNWVSTNGSVATLDSTTNRVTSTATSAANGVTSINATAQGFASAPGAFLTVAQVLASIELKPDTATIAPTGTMHVTARGKDANNRYISGGSFKYFSATPIVATVDSITGVVTGVATGTANVTATSGAITSNIVVVTVGSGGPAIISFGRDTLSVGRGNSQAFPILLSKPAGAPLIVKLTAPAFAHWSTPTVTVPQGETSVNATLVGDSAGTTMVTATDSSGLSYSGASAVAKVTANMRLTLGGYSILANDIATTQVLLSDPSPAGGTYVTFNYSTPGIASVSPDPAFIPAGQLAADIQIRALVAGSTSITPSAIGVNGATSSLTVYPPVLYTSTTSARIGQGQFDQNYYVYTQLSTNVPIPVTLTSTDTNVVRPSPLVATIQSGLSYAYFDVAAKSVGTATITLSSPGWTPQNAISVVATTPYLGVCCGYSLLTTSPQGNVTVYAEDSTRNAHYRTNSLVVHLRSSDSTVIKVLDSVVTIGAGQYYNNVGRFIPGGLGGTAYVVATAGGHAPDSTQYTVTGPSLYLSWGTNRIGAGQEDYNLYVYAQNNVLTPLVVTLVNPDSNVLGLPTSVTIPANQSYQYFNVRGKAPGSVTITATATGYQSVNATYVVTSPRLVVQSGYTINNFAPTRGYVVYATDSTGNAHYRTLPLTLSLRSSDTNVVKTDTVATIGAGEYYTVTRPQLTPVAVGTARVVATATGHGADSTTYTIVQPKLNLSWPTYMIGRRQHRNPTDFYVYTPDSRAVPVAVTLTQKHATVDSLTTTAPNIPANQSYQYFSFYGLTQGVDTIIAAATGYEPDTAFVTVTSQRLVASGLPGSTTTTNPPIGINVYVADSVGSAHYASDTLVIAAVSSDSAVIQPTQRFIRVLKNDYYVSTSVTIVGPGTASITYSDSAGTGYAPTTTNTVTVTGPSLVLANGSTVLGMRQHGGTNSSYVYTANTVGAPLVVHLLSTGTRVATVPDSVIIPAGSSYQYFDVTAQDTIGTIQIQATATGYGGAAMNVQVTHPRFVVSTSTQLNTTSQRQTLTIYATDANGTQHYTTEDVTVTLASSAPSVAGIDSTTVTIVKDNFYTQAARWIPGIVGTSQLSASDTRSTFYVYGIGTLGVQVVTPSLNFGSQPGALGLGQYNDYVYAYTPDNRGADMAVTFTHTGTTRAGTFTNLTNAPITGLTILAGTSYMYFRMAGLARGTDTLTASATSPVHNPATIYTVVDSGRVDPIGSWPGTIKVGDSVQVTLYARDLNTNTHYVVGATQFTLAPNAFIEFHSGGATVTTVTIPADAFYVQFYLVGKGVGTGSVTITNPNYKTYVNTVTVTP